LLSNGAQAIAGTAARMVTKTATEAAKNLNMSLPPALISLNENEGRGWPLRGAIAPRVLALLVCAALSGCEDDGGRLSVAEGLKCAAEDFSGHSGSFSLGDNAIAYSYESANGPAKAIVVFDGWRRPVRTFFESAPHGSHQELMEATAVIKDCVAYGPKSRGKGDKGGATSMMR
jgi:hypothetical protein